MKVLSKIYIFIIFFFLYAPIAVLVFFSFNNSKSRSVWSGFTLKWYYRLFQNQQILSALSNTIIIAIISSVLATIIGTVAAVGIMNMNKLVKKTIMNITNLPMVNPEIVTGVSLMLLFVFIYNKFGILKPGMTTLILAHTTFCLPYVILSVMPKLRLMDISLYEAAQDLGCAPIVAFGKAVIPQVMPGILSGMMMAFTLSIDDFVISYFTSGNTQTLPIVIYSMTRKIVSPEINALSTMLFVVVLSLLLIINFKQIKEISKRKTTTPAKGVSAN